ncbi:MULTISPECIES: ead/Ea22-like family protein [Enterobacter]|uniref:ead/Ea22-like family protein n=1 Tax=Enterobacter TaxID=547 RepID=UPI0009B349AF|nr:MULTISPECIES: ead/Ea22-like family protein [Enterobacter]PAC69524.1 hypothetical protein CGS27_15880 [Enterobacter cloacae]HED1380744.1 ead/Ea22-like family protein [Enterobacter hormaechei subsp. steigerwaltii]ELD7982276.1 ead/Ea22-like family protein [Enterobacter hormaechei]MCM7702124.1 ead/Ea22-like family protein [Enterobacter hormaechei]MCM7707178.1 ead/Ea22-like family protein [Enterobacter hormaechei]
MSNIDKQALRDIASAAVSTPLWHAVGIFGEVVDPAKPEWKPVHDFCKTFTAERVLALLEELEAKDRRIVELTDKPIGWTDEQELRDVEKLGCGYLFNANPITPHADPRRVILLYAAAAGKGEAS